MPWRLLRGTPATAQTDASRASQPRSGRMSGGATGPRPGPTTSTPNPPGLRRKRGRPAGEGAPFKSTSRPHGHLEVRFPLCSLRPVNKPKPRPGPWPSTEPCPCLPTHGGHRGPPHTDSAAPEGTNPTPGRRPCPSPALPRPPSPGHLGLRSSLGPGFPMSSLLRTPRKPRAGGQTCSVPEQGLLGVRRLACPRAQRGLLGHLLVDVPGGHPDPQQSRECGVVQHDAHLGEEPVRARPPASAPALSLSPDLHPLPQRPFPESEPPPVSPARTPAPGLSPSSSPSAPPRLPSAPPRPSRAPSPSLSPAPRPATPSHILRKQLNSDRKWAWQGPWGPRGGHHPSQGLRAQGRCVGGRDPEPARPPAGSCGHAPSSWPRPTPS